MDHEVNIMAKSVNEFKEIYDKLNSLPESVFSQIERAEKGIIGIQCYIKENFKIPQSVFIPNNVTRIKTFNLNEKGMEKYIGVYCEDFFFKIPLRETDKNIEYVFVKK